MSETEYIPLTSLSGARSPGRVTAYSVDIAKEILDRMAQGETLLAICQDKHIPSRSSVFRWVDADTDGFRDKYARARESQGHALAEKAYADAMVKGDAAAQRLAFDAGRWLAGKVAPRHYGDKIDHTLASPDGGPVTFKWES
jgi:hypothetical protein